MTFKKSSVACCMSMRAIVANLLPYVKGAVAQKIFDVVAVMLSYAAEEDQ